MLRSSRDLSEFALRTGALSQQLRDAATEGRLSDVVDLVNQYGDEYEIMNGIDRRIMARDFNKTPLICAIHAGHADIVNALLNARAIDYEMHAPKYFYSPLAEAARMNQPVIFRRLAALPNSPVNRFDWNDNSVLTLTLMHCPDALPALLNVPHLNVNATDKQNRTTLHIIAKQPVCMMSESLLAAVNMLIHHPKINLNARAQSRLTPLMVAAREGNAPLVDVLLTAGAEADLKNKSHETAWDIARKSSHHSVVELLDNAARPSFRPR